VASQTNHTRLDRDSFASLLGRINGQRLQELFNEKWFNDLIPDARAMIGCTQGTVAHLEGDVAVHTSLVFDTLDEVTTRRLNRRPDFIEKLSVVLHDLRKPATRVDYGGGRVGFPGHEELSATEVLPLARKLGLSEQETERLDYIVRYHGDAHSWPTLSAEAKARLQSSPYFESLAALQEADALSCYLPNGARLAVYWDEMFTL
jgi:hypothetical protein